MMNLLGSKKGNIFNSILLIIMALFVFGFVSMFSYLFLTEFTDTLNNSTISSSQIEETGEDFLEGLALFDYVIAVLLVAMIMGLMVSTRRLASSPFAFVIVFLGAPFLGFISYFFNTIFFTIVSENVFAATVGIFPKTMLICTNLHWVTLIAIVLGSITLYGKKEKGQFLQ